MPARMTIHDFIAKWRRVSLGERQASQQHFLDLCAVVGHPTPAAADPTGESFTFERGAARLKARTLTNLYNQRPTWLDLAHRRLDQAVLAAYAWPADIPDE